MPAYFFSQKNIEKNYIFFQKPLDKMLFLWYNIYVIKRAQRAMKKRRKHHVQNHSYKQ